VSVVSAEGDANIVSIVIARHTPAPPTDLVQGSDIRWTRPLTTIETLSFTVQDLELNCPPTTTSNTSNTTNTTNATEVGAEAADYTGGGLVSCPQECVALRSQVVEEEIEEERRRGGGDLAGVLLVGLADVLGKEQVVVVDGGGQLRLLSTSVVRDLMQGTQSKWTEGGQGLT